MVLKQGLFLGFGGLCGRNPRRRKPKAVINSACSRQKSVTNHVDEYKGLREGRKGYRMGWGLSMLAYQVLYPPYSELYGDVSFSWSLLVGYLILATVAALWAVWDARRQPPGPKPVG